MKFAVQKHRTMRFTSGTPCFLVFLLKSLTLWSAYVQVSGEPMVKTGESEGVDPDDIPLATRFSKWQKTSTVKYTPTEKVEMTVRGRQKPNPQK